MSKVTKKQIAERLKLAVEHLAHNKDEIESRDKQRYICLSVDDTSNRWRYLTSKEDREIIAIKKMIAERITPHHTVYLWLHRVAGIPIEQLTADNMQTYRHAWLQELIKEFSK